MTFSHVVVVIPAHNEEAFLGMCLDSVQVAARFARSHLTAGERLSIEVVVVADNCSDATARVAAEHPCNVRVHVGKYGRVGLTRHVGIAVGLRALPKDVMARTWIMNTDADCVVPTEWISYHLEHARQADAVMGTVVPQWAPRESAAVIERYNARYTNAAHHGHVHGANLSCAAGAYLAVGGFPQVCESEDVGLVCALKAADREVSAVAKFPVRTSTRVSRRTPNGFSGYVQSIRDSLNTSVASR